MKKLFAVFLALLWAAPCLADRAELIYDGNLVEKAELQEAGGAEYIPLKSVAALFNGKTQWYPIAGKVVLQLNNRKITFSAGSRSVLIGSHKARMDAAARPARGTLLVPVGFLESDEFGEACDCRVEWDGASRTLQARPRATLSAPHVYSRSRFTRVVFESSDEISPSVKRSGREIMIDVPKARISGEDEVRLNDPVVRSVTLRRLRRGAGISIALAKGATDYSWSLLKDPPRLVVQVANPHPPAVIDEDEPEAGGEIASTAAAVSSAAVESDSEPVTLPPAEKPIEAVITPDYRIRRIVVDAGHGGKDPGCAGRHGTKEKDINLLIAKELARILREEGGYEVLLTRSSDVFVSLIDRSDFANNHQADLFVSIHCNASINKRQKGLEVYYLAENASDPHAEEAEKLENSVVALEGPASQQKLKLQELLSSMAQTEFINEASLFCGSIEHAVRRRVPVEDRGIKQANFHVLHGARMPSVLIETGFLTNSSDEAKLRKRKFRSALVDAVFAAVQEYEKKIQVLQGSRRR